MAAPCEVHLKVLEEVLANAVALVVKVLAAGVIKGLEVQAMEAKDSSRTKKMSPLSLVDCIIIVAKTIKILGIISFPNMFQTQLYQLSSAQIDDRPLKKRVCHSIS